MTLNGDIFPVTMDFVVRGIYDLPSDTNRCTFHLQYLFENCRRSAISPACSSSWRTRREMTANFERSRRHVSQFPSANKTESEKAFQVGFLSFLGNIKVFLMSICAAVTFTILLVIANTMAMSVRERIREVGVLKTLGYTNGDMLGIILGEAAVLSLIGGIFGCGLRIWADRRYAPGARLHR